MRRRVFVHAAGAITALGATWRDSVKRLARGESAVAPVTRFDVTGFPCSVAAAVEGQHASAPDPRLPLLLAALDDVRSHLRGPLPRTRTGIFLGAESGRASWSTLVRLCQAAGGGAVMDQHAFVRDANALLKNVDATVVSPASAAAWLARTLGVDGPVETVSLACASSAAAIAEGARAIALGECDTAVCGGVGADVDAVMLAGFGLLGALSMSGVSRPFDVHRDGFVVGEGAALVVLSSDRDHAPVEILGHGRSMDAHHLTMPDPDGMGVERSMRAALEMAGVEHVDCMQAHGTSTSLNDAVEARAIARVLGARVAETPVSSVKGALGHWIAGAGALGVLCSWEALTHGTVLPTANLGHPDGEWGLRHVMGNAVNVDIQTALVNACAFGGANCSLVLGRAA